MQGYSFNTPVYFSDELKLQTIFPEPVWLLIFKKTINTNLYHRFCATSPYFHKLLLPLRTHILFPDVITLCTKSRILTDKLYFSLLECRAVCKIWKQGVDATLHEILSEANTDPTNWKFFGSPTRILNNNQTRIMYQPNFFDTTKLDKFLDSFHNSHFFTGSNPFPSRSIQIAIRSQAALRTTLYNKLFNVLGRYGHHFYHCYVFLGYQTSEEMQQEVILFRSLLTLLPNLQTLRIEHGVYTKVNSEGLENILSSNPLPKLEKLTHLEEVNIAQPILSQLIRNNPQIIKLRITKLDLNKHSALFTTPLPSLEELHIVCFESESANDFLHLENEQVQWPLKKLTFFCHPNVSNINNVFNFIETRWADSLTDLSIVIPSTVLVEDINPLKLPRLKHLKIKLERYVCMDFILPLSKSLVSLGVYHEGTDEYDNSLEMNSTIKFFLHRENLQKSNIWEHFPRLRQLNFADELPSGNLYDMLTGRM